MLQIARPADRQTALTLAKDFQPKMGKRYASGRNYDRGPGRHIAVSNLSPYLRRRIITEQEVVQLALDAHGLEGAEKFIQEVFWRSYFKGWLERRPSIWAEYKEALDAQPFQLDTDRRLRKNYDAAIQGLTGIECFDAWADELVSTGYLHNHARMWFASIWVFTLRLPWELGADFFFRNLLDGDPASNTCSWRWVAGLHTLGKSYAASAWNIEKFTNGRFAPDDKDFAKVEGAIDDTATLPEVTPVRDVIHPTKDASSVLLLTEEDCSADLSFFPDLTITKIIAIKSSHLRGASTLHMINDFEEAALADAALRLEKSGYPAAEFILAEDPSPLRKALGDADQIVTTFLPLGPLRDWVTAHQVPLRQVMRPWDTEIWPKATAGFFKVKKAIPSVVAKFEML